MFNKIRTDVDRVLEALKCMKINGKTTLKAYKFQFCKSVERMWVHKYISKVGLFKCLTFVVVGMNCMQGVYIKTHSCSVFILSTWPWRGVWMAAWFQIQLRLVAVHPVHVDLTAWVHRNSHTHCSLQPRQGGHLYVE